MRTENFKRDVVSILLVFALVSSIISLSPPASAGDWTNRPEPGGTIIQVNAGENFLIRHVLEWNEPGMPGTYRIIISWKNYDNKPEENFTFLMAEAYFTSGPYNGQSINAVPILASSPSGSDTMWALTVKLPADNNDPRDGDFNVDIWMGSYGVGGVPHIPTDNHPILEQWDGVLATEGELCIFSRAPITIRVPFWTGSAVFSLEDLYTVNVEKILNLENGSKLVVKFYTWGDAFENENVVENFSPPWYVAGIQSARHPEGVGVKKVRLDLTTDNTEDVISTIASFTVRKVDLEIRFMEIPLWWIPPPPWKRVALEIEFSEVPLYWALAPE